MKLKDTLNLGKTAFPMRAAFRPKSQFGKRNGKMQNFINVIRSEPRKTSFHLA